MSSDEFVRLALKRRLISLRDGTHGSFDRVLNGVPLLSAKNISAGRLTISDSESCISDADYESIHRSGYLKHGDVLLSIVGSIGNTAVFETYERVAFQRSVAVLRPDSTLLPRFLFYQLQSPTFQAQLQSATKMSAQAGVYLWDLGEASIVVPSLPAQRAIVEHLDRETARLDALVAAKERVLTLLSEKRRALVTRAVTRGLDSNAPVRGSGIPWLGEIPAHWETPPVYARFEVQLGKMLDEKKIKGTHLAPYLRNSDVQWGAINTTDLPEMDFDEDDQRRYSLRTGDILVCEGGEVGRSALWEGAHPDCYYQKALHRLRPVGGNDEPAFFVLVMRAIVDSGQFALQSSAATIQHLPAEKLRVVRYPAPPLDEQRAIVAHVLSATRKLDGLKVATERTVTLLRERRTALIASAVTGKIDVGGEE